jgi:hypothetical protein
MKKIIAIAIVALCTATGVQATASLPYAVSVKATDNKLSIKIKNDSDDAVSVYNAGSGGSYGLAKNTVTTIKMEAGDKLYVYEKGKKGRLLLTASADMDGKVQLFSKL